MLRRIFIGLVFLLSITCFTFAFNVPKPGGNLPPIEFPNIPHIYLPSIELGDSFLITYGFDKNASMPGVAYNNGKFLVGWFEPDVQFMGDKAAYFKYLDQEGGSNSQIIKLADIDPICPDPGCFIHYMPYSMQVIPYEDDFLIGWVQSFDDDRNRRKATLYYTNRTIFYEDIPDIDYGYYTKYCGINSDMSVVKWDDKIFMFVKEGCWYKDESNKKNLDYSLIIKKFDSDEIIINTKEKFSDLFSEVYDYARSRNFAASKSNKTIFLWQDKDGYLKVWLYPNEVNFKFSIFFNDYKYLDLDCTQEKCLGVADSIGVIIDDANLRIFPAFIIDNNITHGAKVKSGKDVFLVVWVYSNKIYGKFITPDGKALGDTFHISDKSPFTWRGYDIAYDPEYNRFLVVYEVWDNDRSKSNIWGKFISAPKQDLHLNVQGGKVSLQDFDGNQVNCENQECDFKVLGNSNLTLKAEGGQVEWGGDCSICYNNSECTIYVIKKTDCSVSIIPDNITSDNNSSQLKIVFALPVPDKGEVFEYSAIEEPVVSGKSSKCKPFGVGDILQGKVRLKVNLPYFLEPVDKYVALYVPSIAPDFIYMLDSQNNFVSVSLANGDWIQHLPKWKEAMKEEVKVDINDLVFGGEDIDFYSLPSGSYYFYVLVQPAGTQGIGDKYYLWWTKFVK